MTMTYEINLNTITDELVETYNRLLSNDVCIADIYRDIAIKDFKGTINLLVLTGRIEDNEQALRYIDILKDRFEDCKESCEESYELETENIMPCDYSGICVGASCPQFFGCHA